MKGRGKNYQYSQSCQENSIYDVGVSSGEGMGQGGLGVDEKEQEQVQEAGICYPKDIWVKRFFKK